MLAQQQNPHAVSYSLQQQQIDSQEINSEAEADVKTFSIRQYAFACRQRSLLQSWPFAEKYLQMCLDRGLRNVLPPFGLRDNNNNNSSVSESSHDAIPNLNDPSDEDYYDDKNVKVLKSESSPDHHHDPLELMKKQNVMNHGDSGFSLFDEAIPKAMTSLLPEEGMISAPPDCVKKSSHILNCCSSKSSSGKLDRRRRRRRKGRCKKRSMADILAVAKRCTLEEIYRINRFSYAAATGNIIEGYRYETATLRENDPKSTERDDHGVANFDVNVACTN